MKYGFVLDQNSCIGCHACTVACKAENDVVLGSFRTWVKWVEQGDFPTVKRSAAVLRCNHCEAAPCIEICPTKALFKTEDGIVDLDKDRCIGCASCMQACPYDAIHIDDRVGTAAKCHFCAHRMAVDLAPACVSVCPEHAIKVVDLDDPLIMRELDEAAATRRKPERQTNPQTYYLGADRAALDPLAVDGTRTLSHAEVPDPMPAPGTREARSVYDIPKARPWGHKIAAYMVTKALAAGALFAACLSPWVEALDAPVLGGLSLLFTAITVVLLISDLHKPSRFWFLLVKPNTGSWLVKGGWVLTAHGLLSVPWVLGLSSPPLAFVGLPVAFLTSVYTAFLFWQARGRELWSEDKLLPVVLGVQTLAAAGALGWFFGVSGMVPAALYAAVVVLSIFVAPATPHAKQAHRLMVRHWTFPAGVVAALAAVAFPPLVVVAFALLDWIYVKAGQEVPLS